jgi:putative transposase
MLPIVHALLCFMVDLCRSRVGLQLEIVALRHQLALYRRSIRRPPIRPSDRILWTWFARHWSHWREVLMFVQPATVLVWQRRRFREHSAWHSRRTPDRPAVSQELRILVRDISTANPQWGSPRIQGELRKLGIPVAKSTVEKYRVRLRRPASPSWRAFLKNHVSELVALDFFTVLTVSFRVLFVLIVLAHDRWRILHFNVTEHPAAHWTAQQLVEAFPWETAPRYLLRDRDAVYGQSFQQRFAGLGMAQVLTAPRSPWQNPYAERMIGSIRRECLNQVIVLSEDHCRRVLARYVRYYHRWRTHLLLAMDAPDKRPVQLPDQGAVVAVPEVGGLHHHYEQRAA